MWKNGSLEFSFVIYIVMHDEEQKRKEREKREKREKKTGIAFVRVPIHYMIHYTNNL